jgi:hypothetical protein
MSKANKLKIKKQSNNFTHSMKMKKASQLPIMYDVVQGGEVLASSLTFLQAYKQFDAREVTLIPTRG